MNYNYFNNYGFISMDVPEYIMLEVRKEIEAIKSDFSKAESFNNRLAGNIQHQYGAEKLKPILRSLLLDLAYEYEQHFDYLRNIRVLDKDAYLDVGPLWVNFQKSGEYNPMHNHSGVYSFALWVNIPYLRVNELAYADKTPVESNRNGCFTFSYSSTLGGIHEHTVQLDKTLENKIVFFPACMQHAVYPFFTSDEYRISVAGNILFKPNVVREGNR